MQPTDLCDRVGGELCRVEEGVVTPESSWQTLQVQCPSSRDPVAGPKETLSLIHISEPTRLDVI
eukprot:12722448-Prorocentrum_lima.AAC.1